MRRLVRNVAAWDLRWAMTDTTSSPPTPTGRTSILTVREVDWTPAIWLLLVVVCGALFLVGLDLSMIGIALPSIGRALHLSARSLQCIISGYVVGYGGFLLLGAAPRTW